MLSQAAFAKLGLTDPCSGYARTPLLGADELETFGCARRIDVDLCSAENGVEAWRKMLQKQSSAGNSSSATDADALDDGAAGPEEDAAASLLGPTEGLTEAELNEQLNRHVERSRSTDRTSSSQWLATEQNLFTALAPVSTVEEALFMELLPSHLGRSGKSNPNWDKLCTAFNERVFAHVSEGQCCSQNGMATKRIVPYFGGSKLRLKTAAHMKAFAGMLISICDLTVQAHL